VPTDTAALDIIANSDDPRIGWLVTDMQRFAWRPEFNAALSHVAGSLLESDFTGARQRAEMIDHMIAWEIPAYPGYLTHKTRVFTNYLPEWDRIFVEVRLVGVIWVFLIVPCVVPRRLILQIGFLPV